MIERVLLNKVECVVMVCGSCGVTHALPAVKYDTCIEEGGFWSCPNGHTRGYDDSRSARAERQRTQDRLKQENARLAEEAADARRTTEKVEAKMRRIQKRISAGVCPCCNRTFAKLAMHIKSKHPNYNVVPLTAAKA